MKYGIMSANVGPYVAPAGATAIAEAAEQAGFESIWTVEHVVVPREYASAYPYSATGKMPGPGGSDFDIPDPLIWLTWAAAHTTKLRLGTGILILPQRNPVVLAKTLATMDVLSEGRVELGVGIGWLKEEFEIIGASFPDRTQLTEEYAEAMRALWAEDAATFEGEKVKFTEAIGRPRPVNRKIPIHIGGHSMAAARRAGRIGDGFMPAKGDLPAMITEMRQAAEDAGRDPNSIEVTTGGAALLAGGEEALDEVGRMAELGVTRLNIPPLSYNPAEIGEALARFGEEVIARTN